MKTIKIELTDENARRIIYFLRKAYGKDKRTPIERLCKIAILKEVAAQAGREIKDNGYSK